MEDVNEYGDFLDAERFIRRNSLYLRLLVSIGGLLFVIVKKPGAASAAVWRDAAGHDRSTVKDMQTLRIYPTSINDRFMAEAADALLRGGVVVYPTDSLYAIGCDALNQTAIERICRIKGLNPQKNTLSIVCSDISQASEYARIDNRAFAFLRRYLPGAFTFILPAANTLPKAFRGRRTVGVRIPGNPIARRLAEELGRPLLTTSIPSDGLTEDEVAMPDEIAMRCEQWQPDVMIDGGRGATVASTIIDMTDSSSPELIREGAGKWEE